MLRTPRELDHPPPPREVSPDTSIKEAGFAAMFAHTEGGGLRRFRQCLRVLALPHQLQGLVLRNLLLLKGGRGGDGRLQVMPFGEQWNGHQLKVCGSGRTGQEGTSSEASGGEFAGEPNTGETDAYCISRRSTWGLAVDSSSSCSTTSTTFG